LKKIKILIIQGILNIFMVYVVYYSMFLFLDCTQFGFELVNQKNVWNENLKNDACHISCHLPFENDSLSKC
jgi:hypothetical protein